MDCDECGSSGAQSVRIVYGDGNAKTLALCEECFDEFRDAGLVEEASVQNGNGPDSVG